MKKLVGLFLIGCLALVGCSQKEVKEDIIKVGMVTDLAGISDKSFSQITWKGVSEFAEEHENVEAQYITPKDGEFIKVGMVTDLAGISDKSFSQITWKGVSEFAEEHENVEAQYITPKDGELPTLVSAVDSLVISGNEVIVLTGFTFEETAEITWKGVSEFAEEHENVEAQYITPKDGELPTLVSAVDSLVISGNEVIVLTGFTFEETAGQVAKLYPDVKFILIDGQPLVEGEYQNFDNVVSIYFKEHESAFLAGVASALETQTNKLGFVGGIPNEAVKKFGWGYVAGVAYANQTYGTQAQVTDYVYSGSFSDVSMGKQ